MMAAQMGMGAVQSIISAAKASDLPEPEQYSVTPELRGAFNEARTRSQQGYSPAERAAFDQMLARQANSAKNMFRNAGLAAAGTASANIMSIDALNQFAAGSEAVRRQNFGQYAGLAEEIQQVDNMEVGRQNQRLMAEEQALGGGIQAGISNMFQGANTGQNINWMNQAAEIYKGGMGGNLLGNQQQTGFNTASLFNPSGAQSSQGSQNFQPVQWGGFGGNYMGNQQQTGFNNASLGGAGMFNFYGFGQ